MMKPLPSDEGSVLSEGLSRKIAYVALFVLPGLFYLLTVAPSMGVGDSALILGAMSDLHLSSHVNNHPASVLVGWVFMQVLPFDDLAYIGNLSSAFLGALAVGFFGLLLRRTTGSWLVTFIGAGVAMVSHSQWWHSTIVECYAINGLFTVWFLGAAERYRRVGNNFSMGLLFMVSSLMLFNHVQLAFFSVGAGVLLLIELFKAPTAGRRLALFGSACAGYAVGIVPWLILLLIDASHLGFSVALKGAFFGSFQHIMLDGNFFTGFAEIVALLVMQFPSPAFGLAIAAPWLLRGRPALWVPLGLTVAFFLYYNTWDRFAFLLPAFLVITYAGCLGFADLLKRTTAAQKRMWLTAAGAASVVLPIFIYPQLPKLSLGGRFGNAHSANTHNLADFLANPDRSDWRDVDTYIRALFDKLPENAIYFDDDSRLYYPVAFYQKAYGLRPDIKVAIINSWGIDDWGLDRATFRAILSTAIVKKTPVFIISTGHPFHDWIDGGQGTFRFEKFPLDETRWIYRMKLDASTDETSEWTLGEARDPALRDVVRTNRALVLRQPMGEFGPYWHADDQLFLGYQELNGSVTLAVNAKEASRANLNIVFTSAPDFGIIKVELNGKEIGELDLYSEEISRRPWNAGIHEFRAGANDLTFTVVGKNEESLRHRAGIDTVETTVVSE